MDDLFVILRDRSLKAYKRYTRDNDLLNRQLLAALSKEQTQIAIEIFAKITQDFATISAKDIPLLILFLSSTKLDVVEYMIKVEQLLSANQYVGAFVTRYEAELTENRHTELIYNHIITKKDVPNFKLIYGEIIDIAHKTQSNFEEELEQYADITQTVNLIVDRPVIKIELLTPRIKEAFLPKSIAKQIKKTPLEAKNEQIASMKKQRTVMRKKLIKEIDQDQKILHGMKQDIIDHKVQKRQQGLKRGLRMLEEQQMELKKLKTMQLNVVRHKKKSHRKGGNKV